MIYPTLKKLENSGFVKKEKVSQDDKPNKNVFSILSLGEKEFNKSLYKPLQDDEFKSDFLIKIYFGNQFSKSEFINLIKNEIRIKKENLRLLEDNLEKWKNNGMNDNHKFTYDYGIIYYGSIIRFLENKLKQAENI
ncbi:hypothetical protein B808_469 [Fructilactobacillus florum 8D]|uniref:Transcription regulator PadR N-terminal domain-containing protein n=3 Tax=Fructilactobacillus florum TaxID=640331 RepID=W9EER7_9LACO|nr:hypothetical protein B807_60 [Fructilactobacillus florum 2F]ETO40623.1 hypothetical protein B808_469 [Fructilactobacillus florum 8D]KRM91735.1 hypothetical protein FC87_GL000559 [Fructilactobacillus florum DSM 22689 = JCM 16035]